MTGTGQAFALVALLAGCAAHDSAGRRIRTGDLRFDERSISGVNVSYRRNPDGTWAGTRS